MGKDKMKKALRSWNKILSASESKKTAKQTPCQFLFVSLPITKTKLK